MPKEQETASQKGQRQIASPSVFDFLYQDSRRIASLLAQFDPNGVLQSLTRKESFGDVSASTDEYGGGLNLAAITGAAKRTENVSESLSGEAARAYDVLWKNSLSLLAYLQQHNYLQRDLSKAALGQIVLVTGALNVYDVPILKVVFSDWESIRQLVDDKQLNMPKEAAKRKAIFKIFGCLPLSVQATITNSDRIVWAVLNETSLESTATNLFLKYGVTVSGEWSMVGILDALPDRTDAKKERTAEMESITDLFTSFENLAPKIGRPKTAYGITPLLIFRQVGDAA